MYANFYASRSAIESVAERRPDFVQAVIDTLPPVGDEAEAKDLALWADGCANSAYCVIVRRCGHDGDLVLRIEDLLLEKWKKS